MCRIPLIFGTPKDACFNILTSNHCFSYRDIFQNGVNALWKLDDAFLTKNWKSLFGLFNNVQILLACGIHTYYGITNGISDFRCQHLHVLDRLLRSRFFIFPLLLLTVEVQNTICNSLLTIVTTSLQNLNKIGWCQLHKICIYLTKNVFTMLTISEI